MKVKPLLNKQVNSMRAKQAIAVLEAIAIEMHATITGHIKQFDECRVCWLIAHEFDQGSAALQGAPTLSVSTQARAEAVALASEQRLALGKAHLPEYSPLAMVFDTIAEDEDIATEDEALTEPPDLLDDMAASIFEQPTLAFCVDCKVPIMSHQRALTLPDGTKQCALCVGPFVLMDDGMPGEKE